MKLKKIYFLQELEQDRTIAVIILPDVKDGGERKSIALKLLVGGTTAAKATRDKHKIAGGGQLGYTLEESEADFEVANN
jgi:hypothetical protein